MKNFINIAWRESGTRTNRTIRPQKATSQTPAYQPPLIKFLIFLSRVLQFLARRLFNYSYIYLCVCSKIIYHITCRVWARITLTKAYANAVKFKQFCFSLWWLWTILIVIYSVLFIKIEDGLETKQYELNASSELVSILAKKTDPKITNIVNIASEAASKHKIPLELVLAVIFVESRFNPHARSRVGAMGLMQLMPKTAKHLKVKNPLDARQNIDGGVRYLKELLDKFHNDKRLALAAYNAGPGAVAKYRGVPPYRETRHYVTRVLRVYNTLRSSQRLT